MSPVGRRRSRDTLFVSLLGGTVLLAALSFLLVVFQGHVLPVEDDFRIPEWSATASYYTTTVHNNGSNNHLTNIATNSSSSSSSSSRQNETAAICVIVRGESQYIEEFVDYHLALGFDHVYLYDNSVSFELENATFPRTTIRHFPNTQQGRQAKGQHLCIRRQVQPHNHTWVALIDVDEYLVLKQHSNVIDFLRDVCPEGSVSINWVRFGTANHTTYQPLPLTYRFQYRLNMSRIVKPIVRVKDYVRHRSPHWVRLVDNTKRRDTHGNWIRGDWFNASRVYNPSWYSGGTIDVAALHHYMYKSLEEYTHKRCVRGRMSHDYNVTDLLCQNFTLDMIPRGDVFDDAAWQFLKGNVPKYRDMVGGKGS